MFVQVMTDRVANTHEMKVRLKDMEWRDYPEYCSDKHQQAKDVARPGSLSQMNEMAAALAHKFPYVRVDFYEVEGKPVLGEMTFTPGFSTLNMSFEEHLGQIIKMNKE